MNKKYALFVGRYQMPHMGHRYLFETKINQGIPVLVAVRDVPVDEKNPFTAEEVVVFLHLPSLIFSRARLKLAQWWVCPNFYGNPFCI